MTAYYGLPYNCALKLRDPLVALYLDFFMEFLVPLTASEASLLFSLQFRYVCLTSYSPPRKAHHGALVAPVLMWAAFQRNLCTPLASMVGFIK